MARPKIWVTPNPDIYDPEQCYYCGAPSVEFWMLNTYFVMESFEIIVGRCKAHPGREVSYYTPITFDMVVAHRVMEQ